MGFGKGTQYSTSTATQTLPTWLQNAYKGVVGSASNLANSGTNWTPDQLSAFGNIRGLAGSSSPAFNSASSTLASSLTPTSATVGSYMSPYLSDVINSLRANMQETNAQQQQGVIGNAIAKGAMGGNRVGVAQSELARQQALANNQTIADTLNQGYGTALGAAQADKQAMLAAAGQYAGLGATQMQTGLEQAQAQLGAGTQQQQYPYQQQQWLASILGGLGSTAGGTTTQQTPQGNQWSQLLGTGLQLAGMFMRDGGRVHHAASGGVMGAPANDNFGEFAFAPAMTGTYGGARFPTIQDLQQQPDDPLANPTAGMQRGVGAIKDWASSLGQPAPTLHAGYNLGPTLHAGYNLATGGVARGRYAGGGRPTAADVAEWYKGILGPDVPPPDLSSAPPVASSTDATAPINGDRLGLGMGNTSTEPPPMAFAATPDDMGMNLPPPSGAGLQNVPMIGGAGGGSTPGAVPYTTGDQFMTTPQPGYSQNGLQALQSLFAGNGLNLSPDMRQALIAAGAGMASSKSPFVLGGIGEGTQAGIQAWQARQQLERENAAQRAANALTGGQLAATLQQANLTGAQAARTAQAVLTDRYEFTPSMNGMIVANKVNPSQSQVIPYDQLQGWAQSQGGDVSQLPNGGQPPIASQGPEGTRFQIQLPSDARASSLGFTQPGQQIVAGQTAEALTGARNANSAASDATLQLTALRNAAKSLPQTGLLAPGAWAGQRGELVKNFNTLRSIVGMQPVDPDQVASMEEMNKLTTQFGFQLARTTGSDVASTVISQGIGAVPSIENTPQGFRSITSLIQAGLNRTRDWNDYLNAWVKKTGGDTTGASTAFNRDYPPSLYSQAAILDSAVVPKTQSDIDNAPSGTLFNIGGKLMVK